MHGLRRRFGFKSMLFLVVAALLIGAGLGCAFVGAGFVQSGSRAPTNSAASPSSSTERRPTGPRKAWTFPASRGDDVPPTAMNVYCSQ